MIRETGIAELADTVKGKIVGSFDPEVRITGTCPVDNYVPNKVSFVRNRQYAEFAAGLQNAVILVPENLAEYCQKYPQNIYIVVEDVLSALMDIQDFFYCSQPIITEEGISLTAKIDSSAKIGSQVYIGENVFMGRNVVIGDKTRIQHNSCILDNVSIGSGTYIHPNVSIYKNCRIGKDCIIDSGVSIGPAGFRIEQDVKRKVMRRMLHVGRVVIGDRVEIGANCTIDRATFENDVTRLSDDVKLDDQVHIGHNAKIGARTTIAAQTCIAGSVKTGEDVWIGAGVTVSNGVSIGNRTQVLLNAVVAYDIPEDDVVSGFYAMPHRQWKRVYSKWKKES